MSIVREDITLLEGAITARVARPETHHEPATGKPLLVFVHGGGATALTMDIPGHSLLELATDNGFTVVAPNRPGYGGSRILGLPADSEEGTVAANAERLYEAIGEAWARYGAGAPGVVVYGSSIGGAVTLSLASQWAARQEPEWPLLGVAIADVAQQPREKNVVASLSTPVTEYTNLAALQPMMDVPPLWTIPAYAFDAEALPGIFEPAVRSEAIEIVTGWPRRWSEVLSTITVPVHYRIGQFDTMWNISDELVGEFTAALRTRSPYVDASVFSGSAHGVADSPAGFEYVHLVLGFAVRCAANVSVPQLLEA